MPKKEDTIENGKDNNMIKKIYIKLTTSVSISVHFSGRLNLPFAFGVRGIRGVLPSIQDTFNTRFNTSVLESGF